MILFWQKKFCATVWYVQWKQRQAYLAYNIFQILVHTKKSSKRNLGRHSGMKIESLFCNQKCVQWLPLWLFWNSALFIWKNYKNDYFCQTVQLLKIVPFLSYFAYCLRKAKLYPMKDFEISDLNLLFSTNGRIVTYWPPRLWECFRTFLSTIYFKLLIVHTLYFKSRYNNHCNYIPWILILTIKEFSLNWLLVKENTNS